MAQRYRQAAVIPYRMTGTHLEVALVTSANGRRWTLPKGTVNTGERPWEAAIREAEEEGGLCGTIDPRALGSYWLLKAGGLRSVEVFLLKVTVALDRWPEDSLRQRRWVSIDEALVLLRPEVSRFVRALEPLVQRIA